MSAYAVDAVVVQREDGTRHATAFHVRFEPTTRAQLRRASTSISQRATRALRWARGGEDDGGFSEDEEEENDVRVELDGEGMVTCECVSDGDDGWCRFAGGDRPSAEELASWPLKPGRNDLTYTSGARTCRGRCYLWQEGDRVLACDVDGTVTKSDVRGFLDSTLAVTPTHAHEHVCAFMAQVVAPPRARMLYLTNRPAGWAGKTRAFLAKLDQRGARLPDGPVLCQPADVMAAFAGEVTHAPNPFKTKALLDVARAGLRLACGFGNNARDADAYARAGVPDLAIFVIDEASSITLPRAHKSAGRFDGYGDAALVERVRGLLSDVVDRLMEATGDAVVI